MRWGCSTAGSPADTVVVVGAGPIGLAAITVARLFTPARVVAVDPAASRLEAASRFGADVTVRLGEGSPADVVGELTDALGADVAHRCGGRAGQLRDVYRPGPPGRSRCEHRRPRQTGNL